MIRKNCGFGRNKSRKKDKNREKLIFLGSLFLLSAFLLLQFAARYVGGFGEWYGTNIYPLLTGSLGWFFGLFPFSVVEVLLYLVLLLFILYSMLHLRQWRKILNRTFFLITLLLFLFTINCGINYYRRPFSQFLPYKAGAYSAKDLEELLAYLTEQVNLAEAELTDGKNRALTDRAMKDSDVTDSTVRDIAGESVKAMKGLGAEYPALSGFYPQPKELLLSRILSVQQLSGIYSPFTIEANYNGEMVAYNLPHTVCHELSHLRGFMQEDEANFIGFLACIGSEDPAFRYSGYLMGFIYAGNALAAEDRESYSKYWAALNKNTQADLNANNLFWDRFDTKTAKVAEAINDTYLKVNSQSDGVKSYGKAVDLILEWYQQ